jgi:signal transduction histidine kinase
LGEKIDRSAQSLTNFLDNLLNWALLQKGEISFNPETLDLPTLVADNILTFSYTAGAHKIQLVHKVPDNMKTWADRTMLQTILHNLISNALKFTPQGGKITIEAHPHKNGINIICQDTGVGIPAEKLVDIFKVEVRKNNKGLHGEKGLASNAIKLRGFIIPPFCSFFE